MGGFVRVAAPIAISLAAPHLFAGLGFGVSGLNTIGGGLAIPSGWSTLLSAGLSGLNNAMQYQQQGYAEYQAAQQRNMELQQQYAQQADRERRRQIQLKQASASQRANMGALGMADSSSGEAVLSGLYRKGDEETALERQRLDLGYRNLLDASHSKSQWGMDLFIKSLAPTVRLLREQ
ncbi:MAG: hypothetical protein H7841_17530 [Magnetospirillum sp. WYHS-4]